MGYPVKGLPRDEEVQSIIKWLWESYRIHVYVIYTDIKYNIKPNPYMKFCGAYRINCQTEYSMVYFCQKRFENPYDAYYEALRYFLPGFKYNNKPIK